MATFATITELAVRLGRVNESELTAAQQAQADLLLELATGLITQAVDRDTAWQDALTPVPVLLRAVCLEMCARVMTNPSGVRSEGETVGSYQHNVSYTDGSHLLMLTDSETLLVRRAVHSATSASAAVESLATTVATNMPTSLDELMTAGETDTPIYDWTP